MKKFKHTRILYIWIAMLFAASFVLQVPVYAAPEEKQSWVYIQNSGQAERKQKERKKKQKKQGTFVRMEQGIRIRRRRIRCLSPAIPKKLR